MYSGPPSRDDDDEYGEYEYGASKLDLASSLPIPSSRPPPTQRHFRHGVRSYLKLLCELRSLLHRPSAATATATTAIPHPPSGPALLPSARPSSWLLGTTRTSPVCASPPAEPRSGPRRCAEPAFFVCPSSLSLEPLWFATPVLGCVKEALTSRQAGLGWTGKNTGAD